jgi:monoterpene epsilon-lactone hydrolase
MSRVAYSDNLSFERTAPSVTRGAISRRAVILRSILRAQKRSLSKVDTPIAELRRHLARIEPFVPGRRKYTAMVPVDANGVPALRVAVPDSRSDRCILYFHGGGYAVGTAALYRDFLWRVAEAARAHVLYFDYRLAPEHPFPAALDDAVSAYRWVAGRYDCRHVAFFGDSAGGGLVFAAMLKMRDEGYQLPRAAVALSPWTDLTMSGASWKANAAADPMMDAGKIPQLALNYAGGADPAHPYVSPVYGDTDGLPSTLIHCGSDEILRDDSVRMADKMRSSRCEVRIEVWPKMPHVWQLYARILPEGRSAIGRIGKFLQDRI